MKFRKLGLSFLFILFLSSCVQIDEEVTINKDGSGIWTMKMDMSQLLELMANMVGKDEMAKQMPTKKMDTIIYFKSFVDTSGSLSAEKKKVLRNGELSLRANLDSSMLKTEMKFPFKSVAEWQTIYNSVGDSSMGMGNMFKSLGAGGNDSQLGQAGQGPDPGQINSLYRLTCRNGYISRTLNQEKFQALKQSPEFDQMKQAGQGGMEIPYTITIHLPRPVKKLSNTFAKTSEDKKTVTLKYSLSDMLDHPERFEYTIEY